LLPQAVAFLAARWEGSGPLDLSRTLVVVPTRQSGRRLREALALHAEARGRAVFPPRVLSPEALVVPDPSVQVASRLQSLLAWVEVLREADLDAWRAVFPVDPPARNFAWSLGIASTLLGVQATLAEGGLRLGTVLTEVRRRGERGEFPEGERWRQLAGLEEGYDAILRRQGLADLQAARIEASRHPSPPADADRIVVVGTPDPLPLAVTTLSAHSRVLPVEVLVFAPEGEADAFDEWGRPVAARWEARIPAIPGFEDRLRLCADPFEQAGEIAALAEEYGRPEGSLAVGIADAGIAPSLESALRRSGFEVFNPAGIPRRRDELFPLLAALAAFCGDADFDDALALARCPAVLRFLRARLGDGFSAAPWLAGLDELRRRHLPAGLAAARGRAAAMAEHPMLAPALSAMEEVCAAVASKGFAEGASAGLAAVFAGRRLDLAHAEDARLAQSAAAWMEVVRACSAAAPGLEAADAWALALRLYGEEAAEADKPAGSVELLGWLELAWEDAPHLVVAGMNDGCVPESVAGDPFLPEGLRERLGLMTNAARFARDAYLLQALAAWRRDPGGRLDLLLGKVSALGDPLKPSRLLLRCGDADLPGRVALLFRPVGLVRPQPPWTRAWRLAPRRVPPPSRVNVTALRDWLECPFRFYLRHLLGMRPLDAAKSELDDLDFGSLCHRVLETMGRHPELRESTDGRALAAFLSDELDRAVRSDFGDELGLPLILQRESARQRLRDAAWKQARECAAGWRVVAVERSFEVRIGGLLVRGKIDRVDRHVDSGAVRVLDYKTSDKAKAPDKVHVRRIRADEGVPDWVRCGAAGPGMAWADLQLPVYRHALAAEFPGIVGCGYFNLPKAAGDGGISLWEGFSPEMGESALACAEGVCRAIRDGRFWPPNERVDPERDDFAPLFQRGVAASVTWEEPAP
jgi:ATP-dependent helicase/nuclease subunit B